SITRWYTNLKVIRAGGYKGEWIKQDSFRADWNERFHVHQSGSSLFFVTESGRLLLAKAGEGGELTLEEPRKGEPTLVALLVDTKTSRAFAFGKDFFFELKDKIQPSRCEDVTRDGSRVRQPIQILLACAQVLRKAEAQGKPKGSP